MIDDPYKLGNKSDAELHEWIVDHQPGTAEYIAGIQESMRRVASIEEVMEKVEAPVRKRELIAVAIAIVSIVITIVTIVVLS